MYTPHVHTQLSRSVGSVSGGATALGLAICMRPCGWALLGIGKQRAPPPGVELARAFTGGQPRSIQLRWECTGGGGGGGGVVPAEALAHVEEAAPAVRVALLELLAPGRQRLHERVPQAVRCGVPLHEDAL